MCLTPDGAVRVQALARDIVLCSWARHLAFTVPLSTQVCGMGTGKFNAWGNQGGVAIFILLLLLLLRDGAISHNRPQITSDRTIHEKSHNSQKNAQQMLCKLTIS